MGIGKSVPLLLWLALPLTAGAQANSGGQAFTITIAAENPKVNAGSNVCVKVSLMNSSSKPLELSGGAAAITGMDPNYRFEIRDKGGNILKEKAYQNTGVFSPTRYNYTLEPNGTHDQDQCPSALYNMRTPGRYTIQAFRRASDNSSNAPEIASNIVGVTVLPVNGSLPPFTIITATIHPEEKVGSDVCIQVSLTNNSPHDLNINSPVVNGMDYEFRFEVRDDGGNLIPEKAPPAPSLCPLPALPPQLPLPPFICDNKLRHLGIIRGHL